MSDIFRLPLAQIQPSQLYLNRAKLASVDAAWHPRNLAALPPVPVKCLDGCVIYTDGHHRAFAAYRSGFDDLPVFWDEDELDWDAYRICVAWCRDAGITTAGGLEGRILAPEDYAVQWLDRCRTMQDDLAARRARGRGAAGQ